jgi:hypothetical protein
MAQAKLAELLLRRKELEGKVRQLQAVQQSDMAEFKVARVKVHEGIDEVKAQVPKVTMNQVTAAHDWYAKQLRFCDGAIQRANWETNVEVAADVLADYVEPTALTDAPVKTF